MQEFSENQIKAIQHNKGPMMVLAGPGSGKTTVITHRVKHMVEILGIKGDNILVITFTRAAAAEMESRFRELAPESSGVFFGTFHSIFFQILRDAYSFSGGDIIPESEKYRLIGELIERRNIAYDNRDEFIKNFISEISYVKGEMLNAAEFESKCGTKEEFLFVYQGYDRYLRNNRKIDFDDILVFCYELLKARKDIRLKWINRFRYILIDEFQDINGIQYEIVKLLMSREKNLFIVGDDDQSVYSFRGASPELMLNFHKDFPEVVTVYLNINYRCSKDIVAAAKRLIGNNKNRFQKDIESPFKGDEQERIHIIKDEKVKDEATAIAKRISELESHGVPFGQMAVLYRTNAEPRGLTVRLMEHNIPFRMRDGIPNLFEHFTAANILDYIKLALGDKSRSRYLRIINRPNRYISREMLNNETVDLEELEEKYRDRPAIIQNIVTLRNDLEKISSMNPYGAINYIRKAVGYDAFLLEYGRYRGVDPEEYYAILDEMQEMSKDINSFSDWFDFIVKYSEDLKEAAGKNYKNSDAVTLATMHSAKGLEFDYVCIMNCVEGNTPHKKSQEAKSLEEERRMFYVAVTRARYGLDLHVPGILYGRKTQISRFITEMSFDISELKTGKRIVHERYGEGVITYIDEKRLSVYFDNIKSNKTLSLDYTISNGLIRLA